jgi:hypothetical protein
MQYGVSWAKFESMGTRKIAEAVCRMPSEFYERRNISMLDLLKESGYLGFAHKLTVAHKVGGLPIKSLGLFGERPAELAR